MMTTFNALAMREGADKEMHRVSKRLEQTLPQGTMLATLSDFVMILLDSRSHFLTSNVAIDSPHSTMVKGQASHRANVIGIVWRIQHTT